MYREQLCINIDPEAFKATLSACALTDKDDYSEQESTKFAQARQLIEQGQTYEQVAAFFQAASEDNGNGNGKSAKPKKNSKKADGLPGAESQTTFPELIKLASEQLGQPISWLDGAKLLQACGLSDAPDYRFSDCEVELFLDSMDRWNDGESLDSISQLVGSSFTNVVDETDENLAEPVEQFLDDRAERQAIDIQRRYLQKLADVPRTSVKFQQNLAQLKEGARAFLEGEFRPSPRSLKSAETPSLPPSSPS